MLPAFLIFISTDYDAAAPQITLPIHTGPSLQSPVEAELCLKLCGKCHRIICMMLRKTDAVSYSTVPSKDKRRTSPHLICMCTDKFFFKGKLIMEAYLTCFRSTSHMQHTFYKKPPWIAIFKGRLHSESKTYGSSKGRKEGRFQTLKHFKRFQENTFQWNLKKICFNSVSNLKKIQQIRTDFIKIPA